MALIDEAVAAGARLRKACEALGLTLRTVERWRRGVGEDLRCGPRTPPANRLTEAERRTIVEVSNSVTYRDLSPNQIVPLLADQGRYIASEKTFYRVLAEANQLRHREGTNPPNPRPRPEHVATGPNQLWSWDITYLASVVRGQFHKLYLIMDVWSRKIVGWAVHEEEDGTLAKKLFVRTYTEMGIDPEGIVFHSDNGGPMKAATLKATLEKLKVIQSFSRPRVSDDNPYSESLFRTLKYRPEYPSRPFASIEEARRWVAAFVRWYNTEHLHSGIGFVTPEDRHEGRDVAILAARKAVYEQARRRRPERWSRTTRRWEHTAKVELVPVKTAAM
jgi:putative transposase